MKYVVVIALVALLFVLLYRRLRPYLESARDFLNTIRQIQRAVSSPQPRPGGSPEKLVQCARCGIWIPMTRALTPRSGELLFCSAECLSGKKAPSR